MIKDDCIVVNSIKVECDYETGEHCGAGGTFQVLSVTLDTDFREIDITNEIDQGVHFNSLEEVAIDLGFSPSISIEEI